MIALPTARRAARVALIALGVLLVSSAPAYAADGHVPLVTASIPIIGPVLSTLGGAVGSIFSTIGGAILGAFTWTIGLATKFILTTIAALVKMLIPHAWVHEGLQIMQWIVAVPDYAGKVSSPGGGHAYGFAGINALRDVFTWLGVAIAPLTLVYATSRAMIGEGDPVGIPVLRMLAVTAVIVSYPYWWSQAAALADQITNTILSVPAVSRGLYKLMEYAVDGVALGGWQLIDLGLMGAIGLELIGLIFLKVVVILLGALLYATGPVTIGLVPTRAGSALARAWASAAVALLLLGIAWATLFAVGALLIGDAGSAGPLIAGNSALGSLAGGLLLAVAGLASLWLCLKAAREMAGLLRLQLSGLLVLGGQRVPPAATPAASARRTTGQSLREYGARVARAAGAAGGELALAGAGSGAFARAGRGAGYVGRRGLIGTAAAAGRTAAAGAAPAVGAVFARSRPGAAAVRMARAGTASWQATPRKPRAKRPEARTTAAAAQVANATRQGAGPGRSSAPGAARSGAPAAGSPSRSSTGRESASTPTSSSGSRPVASSDRSVRSSEGRSSSSARPTSRQPVRQPARRPPEPRDRSTPRAPAPEPARKPFAARRPRPFRTRKPPKGDAR
jgi:hypothetical protein